MRDATAHGMRMDYFDIFAEPNWGWNGVTIGQQLELFRITYDIVRKYQPNLKIVALDHGGLNDDPDMFQKIYAPFLDYIVKNNLRLDAVSWHEFSSPEVVLPHVEEVRQLISARPALCNPTCPEIHINEYTSSDNHLVPGANVGYLYYFEKAGVDVTSRACWDDVGYRWSTYSTCWEGVDGMFLKDNITTTNVYWVYQKYAEMNHERIFSSGGDRTVAIADLDEVKHELKILIGRFGHEEQMSDVKITLKNLPPSLQHAKVRIWHIPNEQNRPSALPEPVPDAPQTVDSAGELVLSHFKDGDAYYLVLKAD
jgi:hypothetical protein